jgi:hypothetical protein
LQQHSLCPPCLPCQDSMNFGSSVTCLHTAPLSCTASFPVLCRCFCAPGAVFVWHLCWWTVCALLAQDYGVGGRCFFLFLMACVPAGCFESSVLVLYGTVVLGQHCSTSVPLSFLQLLSFSLLVFCLHHTKLSNIFPFYPSTMCSSYCTLLLAPGCSL